MYLEITLFNGNIFTIKDGLQKKFTVDFKEQIKLIKLLKDNKWKNFFINQNIQKKKGDIT